MMGERERGKATKSIKKRKATEANNISNSQSAIENREKTTETERARPREKDSATSKTKGQNESVLWLMG